jgi:excisionase family DNA binding protein
MKVLDQRFYTLKEAAVVLRVKESTVQRWIRTKQLKASSTRPYLIAERELKRFLNVSDE